MATSYRSVLLCPVLFPTVILANPKSAKQNLQQTTLECFYFYISKKIRLDVLCESSARQRIHMKYQVLFSLKNNEKVFMNVVCCSRD